MEKEIGEDHTSDNATSTSTVDPVNATQPTSQGKVKCPTCEQYFAPGRGIKLHMNWHKRNTTANVVTDNRSRCRICGKIANSPSSLSICEKSHKK